MAGITDNRDEFNTLRHGRSTNLDVTSEDHFGEIGHLNFQSFDQNTLSSDNRVYYSTNRTELEYYGPTEESIIYADKFTYTTRQSVPYKDAGFTSTEEEEPPLLEELGIYPERILEKTVTVLNLFRNYGPADDIRFLVCDADLAGPLAFCLALAACLLLSGGKAHFGYVYGLAVISVVGMYILLNLMTNSELVTLMSVASILGYCLLPVVGLSAIGVFISLRNPAGLLITALVVWWCSMSASRLFITMSTDAKQRPLLAYPCALLYSVFTLIAVF